MNDDRGPLDRGLDPFASRQVTPQELDAVLVLVALPAEHPEFEVAAPKARYNEAPERARTAGDENAIVVGRSSVHHWSR